MRRALALALAACAPATPSTPPEAPPPPLAAVAPPPPPVSEWADATSSSAGSPDVCGASNPALARAAEKLLAHADAEVEPILRMVGSPAVRPRVITVHGAITDLVLGSTFPPGAQTRCGRASREDTTTVVVADFLADLDPLPTRARTGAWLTFSARLAVPASSAKLVVLGERGIPRYVPTSSAGDRVRARFALDRPGAFTVQLVADVAGGPRPVLEARVFADVAPTSADPAAPGEAEASLDAMIAAVRKEEGLRPLSRDARLDALAKAHVERMVATKQLAHDAGDGDLAARFEAEGYAASTVGENVARARTLALAHRALYASPSHRANLLGTQFTRFGFAVLHDERDHLWVCEVFASAMR